MQMLLTAGGRPEPQLWELRCQLASAGIRHREVRKVFDLAKRPKHRGKDRVQRMEETKLEASGGEFPNLGALVEDVAQPSRARHIDRKHWLRLCTELDLPPIEADRLFIILGGEEEGEVDVDRMFEALRALLAPDVCLERFAAKVLSAHASVDDALESVCPTGAEEIHWSEFHVLCAALDVNDHNASRLWRVLCEAQDRVVLPDLALTTLRDQEPSELTSPKALDVAKTLVVTKVVFVRQLEDWAPDTALGMLRSQICDRYETLAECKRALARKGIGQRQWLSARDLDEVLKQMDLHACDAARIFATILESQQKTKRRERITLRQTFRCMEASQRDPQHAHDIVRDETSSVWRRLHVVQADLLKVPEQQQHPKSSHNQSLMDQWRATRKQRFVRTWSSTEVVPKRRPKTSAMTMNDLRYDRIEVGAMTRLYTPLVLAQ